MHPNLTPVQDAPAASNAGQGAIAIDQFKRKLDQLREMFTRGASSQSLTAAMRTIGQHDLQPIWLAISGVAAEEQEAFARAEAEARIALQKAQTQAQTHAHFGGALPGGNTGQQRLQA